MEEYQNARLDHLGIVAGVCQELGLAAWIDEQIGPSQRTVSVGTATVAMILNGLGFSNRQLYLVPQFFASKPVALLLGADVHAAQLNDDTLGRALDALTAADLTTLFAGIAQRARQQWGIDRRFVHVDTTSFAVSGAYETDPAADATIAITYGYSRDKREDLKQWMLALATTHDGDVPLFLRPLNGNSADVHSLRDAVLSLQSQLAATPEEASSIYVADSGLYRAENMERLQDVAWICRVPERSTDAKAVVAQEPEAWQSAEEGALHWWGTTVERPYGAERWLIVRTVEGEERARAAVERQVTTDTATWTKRLWHLSNQTFACAADAEAALRRLCRTLPAWLQVGHTLQEQQCYAHPGRPAAGTVGTPVWTISPTLEVVAAAVQRESERRACFIVGTNQPVDALSDAEVIATYRGQGSVERGFRFLKDPLFLASSVFVKTPARIAALGFIMVLCLLIYRLAEHRLRTQLAATGQTIPSQTTKPTAQPTLRWVFQLFEGIDVLTIPVSETVAIQRVLGLRAVHRQIVALLGPGYQALYAGQPWA